MATSCDGGIMGVIYIMPAHDYGQPANYPASASSSPWTRCGQHSGLRQPGRGLEHRLPHASRERKRPDRRTARTGRSRPFELRGGGRAGWGAGGYWKQPDLGAVNRRARRAKTPARAGTGPVGGSSPLAAPPAISCAGRRAGPERPARASLVRGRVAMLLLKAPTRVLEGAAFSSRQAGLALAVDFSRMRSISSPAAASWSPGASSGRWTLSRGRRLEELAQGELVG